MIKSLFILLLVLSSYAFEIAKDTLFTQEYYNFASNSPVDTFYHNSSIDSILIDSIKLKCIRINVPAFQLDLIFQYPGWHYLFEIFIDWDSIKGATISKYGDWEIPPNSEIVIHSQLDLCTRCPASKISKFASQLDTMLAQLRFYSQGSDDSVFIKSIQRKPYLKTSNKYHNIETNYVRNRLDMFNLLGKAIENKNAKPSVYQMLH
jgi:hypothetical protein